MVYRLEVNTWLLWFGSFLPIWQQKWWEVSFLQTGGSHSLTQEKFSSFLITLLWIKWSWVTSETPCMSCVRSELGKCVFTKSKFLLWLNVSLTEYPQGVKVNRQHTRFNMTLTFQTKVKTISLSLDPLKHLCQPSSHVQLRACNLQVRFLQWEAGGDKTHTRTSKMGSTRKATPSLDCSLLMHS